MMTRCGPSERVAAVTDQAPPPPTSPVSVWSARVTVTVAPGAPVAVPEMTGVASLVSAFAPPAIVTAGATVSTVSTWLSVLWLPAGSVTDAVTVRVPSLSALGVTFHVPPDCTSAVRVCASTLTRTTVPGATSLVPAIVGVGSFVTTEDPPSIVTIGRYRVDGQLLGGAAGVSGRVTGRGDDRVGACWPGSPETPTMSHPTGVAVRV